MAKNLHLSARQLWQYLSGKLLPKEQHDVEKAALENPLYDDALEGFALIKKDKINPKFAKIDLEKRLQARIGKRENKVVPFWQYASAAAVVIGVGLSWWGIKSEKVFNKSEKVASRESEKVAEVVLADKPKKVEKYVKAEDGVGLAQNYKSEKVEKKVAPRPVYSQTLPETVAVKVAILDTANSLTETEAKMGFVEPAQKDDDGAKVKKEEAIVAATPAPAMAAPKATSAVAAKMATNGLTFSGLVKSLSDGEALPGVSLTVKGSNRGVSSDANGQFLIQNLKKGDRIVANYVGFEPQEWIVNQSENKNIELKESANALSEVVVTGYAVQEKEADFASAKPVLGWNDFETNLKKLTQEYKKSNPNPTYGRVRIRFEVDETGKLSNFKFSKILAQDLQKQILDWLKSTNWQAENNEGKPRKSRVSVKIDL